MCFLWEVRTPATGFPWEQRRWRCQFVQTTFGGLHDLAELLSIGWRLGGFGLHPCCVHFSGSACFPSGRYGHRGGVPLWNNGVGVCLFPRAPARADLVTFFSSDEKRGELGRPLCVGAGAANFPQGGFGHRGGAPCGQRRLCGASSCKLPLVVCETSPSFSPLVGGSVGLAGLAP